MKQSLFVVRCKCVVKLCSYGSLSFSPSDRPPRVQSRTNSVTASVTSQASSAPEKSPHLLTPSTHSEPIQQSPGQPIQSNIQPNKVILQPLQPGYLTSQYSNQYSTQTNFSNGYLTQDIPSAAPPPYPGTVTSDETTTNGVAENVNGFRVPPPMVKY